MGFRGCWEASIVCIGGGKIVHAWAGQYTGRSGSPTVILVAVADYDLWIWHAYVGLSGSNNDINVLSKSHLFANLANGVAHPTNYVIQGK